MRCILPRHKPWRACPLRQRLPPNSQQLPRFPFPYATSSPIVMNTFTSVPPLSPVPVSRCDSAAFVGDVTYPDGSTVPLGGAFTKIWRLQNTGTCTWTTSYALVYVTGERFSAPAAVAMPTSVGPGQTVDLAVNLTAPIRMVPIAASGSSAIRPMSSLGLDHQLIQTSMWI